MQGSTQKSPTNLLNASLNFEIEEKKEALRGRNGKIVEVSE
jgi:hypothetical protein